jgi:LCP family protein required for cell wall assembly
MFTNIRTDETQPHIVSPQLEDTHPTATPARSSKRRIRLPYIILLAVIAFAALILFPVRQNILIIGLDRPFEGTTIARSDTLILTGVQPIRAQLAMLSIPRDLWVEIPGVGYNRINAAHYFAESDQAGSGPEAVMDTIEHNFNVQVDGYIRVQFDGLVRFVDALGGVPMTLERQVGKLAAGDYVLTGEQALAFVRDRSGSDDFFRMEHGQLFIKAVFRRMLQPTSWPRIPAALFALSRSMDNNLNLIEWLRLAFTFLEVGPEGVDSRQITREMTAGFITEGGAQVLEPKWDEIRPLTEELFGSH